MIDVLAKFYLLCTISCVAQMWLFGWRSWPVLLVVYGVSFYVVGEFAKAAGRAGRGRRGCRRR